MLEHFQLAKCPFSYYLHHSINPVIVCNYKICACAYKATYMPFISPKIDFAYFFKKRKVACFVCKSSPTHQTWQWQDHLAVILLFI
uniref:Uncharacterized protein n=1 Tax=Arundo donax TaxID=35708 RepID=A0A0A9HEA1_ARUDO